MANFNSKPMTYERLWQVLVSLGFQRMDRPEYLLFTKESCDALVALPYREPDAPIHFWHEAAARSAVAMRGIASVERFYELLEEPMQSHSQAFNNGSNVTPNDTDGKSSSRSRTAVAASIPARKTKRHRILSPHMN